MSNPPAFKAKHQILTKEVRSALGCMWWRVGTRETDELWWLGSLSEDLQMSRDHGQQSLAGYWPRLSDTQWRSHVILYRCADIGI